MSKCIQSAIALRDTHLEKWKPQVTPSHRYWTRAQKKRIDDAIQERDSAYMSECLTYIESADTDVKKVVGALILFTYLSTEQRLVQQPELRRLIWGFLCKFENITNQSLTSINTITNYEEYQSEIFKRNLLHDLRYIMGRLRMIMSV